VAGADRSGQKKEAQNVVRTAETPGQALNVDLCFVPAEHASEQKLPAVSGSSGRLVIEQPAEPESERTWPGRVFEDRNLDYSEAMLQFVAASQAKSAQSASAETVENDERSSLKAQKRVLRQEENNLREARRVVRQQRKQENTAWQTLRSERRQQQTEPASSQQRKAQDEHWRGLRTQRRATLAKRKADDQQWREVRHAFRERWSQLPIVTAWIAILVITDNCTRQCLGLPLFVAGSKVTAEMIVSALQALLPPELLFLISDRGVHFTAKAFQSLVQREAFFHVLIARHRPQSNGIAERFVRTLKEWLKDKSWENDQVLVALLELFLAEYNDRPHQGLSIPGLSPNEFANRIWLI
jgi:transposase InsO family protein